MEPLVSILIPAYNSEEFIADSIRSALAQTWSRKELIIVDDGSKDRTLEIARQFESENVRVFCQANQGAAAARNQAFAMCQGDYIQWLDADDLLSPDKIARQMEAVERSADDRTLLSSRWGHFLYRPAKVLFSPSPLWRDLSPLEWLLTKMEHNCHMQTSTWLVSRQLTEAAGPWNAKLFKDNDGEYFRRVLLASSGTRFVPEGYVLYRITGADSVSYMGGSRVKLESLYVSCKLHVESVMSLEDSSRSRAACLKYLQKYLYHFYPEEPDIVSDLREQAATLGGTLAVPCVGWKFGWIQRTFGFRAAKRVRRRCSLWRLKASQVYDKTMLRLSLGKL